MDRAISLRWFDIDVASGLYAESFMPETVKSLKEKVLSKLKVKHTESTPLDSWLKTMHEENDLPYSKPAHKLLTDAIQDNTYAFKFMFWLA